MTPRRRRSCNCDEYGCEYCHPNTYSDPDDMSDDMRAERIASDAAYDADTDPERDADDRAMGRIYEGDL